MKKKEGSKIYLLDTSAVLALWNAEDGADTVEDILKKSSNASVFVSFMTFMECRYCIWKKKGKAVADEFYRDLSLLPIKRVDVDDVLINIASEMKATNNLSVADSWIIASAIKTNSTLVHKDPEFEQIADRVDMLKLPYK
ncbi:MAG: PIN domain-containing protein [Deltaproteobacteria bacterium]|nr:PIN domain-containing protein [Deltaproteobacteria bacterium]